MKTIVEYLSVKQIKNNVPKITELEFGVSVDEIIDWLKAQGVEDKDFIEFNGDIHVPEEGKLLVEKGPCENGSTNSWWVSVANHPHGYKYQKVVLRTKSSESFYYNVKNENKHPITFDKGVKKIIQMLSNPEVIF